MIGIKIKIDGNEFYFSDKTSTFQILQEHFCGHTVSKTLTKGDLISFKDYIINKISLLLKKFAAESKREKLSRVKKVVFKQSEYELNLSVDNHLLIFNLISILNELVANGVVIVEYKYGES